MTTDLRGAIDFRIRVPKHDSPNEQAIKPHAEVAPYGRLYPLDETENISFDELVEEMEQFGVQGIMQAEYETGSPTEITKRAAEFVSRRPDLFLGGIATADPRDPLSLEHLRWAHDNLGLKGWVFQPAFLQVYANDPRCMRLYAYCEANGHPVTIHTGVNFSKHGAIDFGRPLYIDHVACLFPELTIVCNHGGWPWVTEMIAVMWKHENVFADFGAVAPKYLADPKGGWGPITHWMNSQLSEKVLFGTDWPMLHYDRVAEELPLLGLSDTAMKHYIRGNADRLIAQVWGEV